MGKGMIVTTGRIIKIDAAEFFFERTSETPGCVHVRDKKGVTLKLPANPREMESWIAAYRRACGEDVGYRESGVE
jgi:hypothetical protein